MLDNNGEYRYYGANPNNYVEFNDELWRIISVSNVKSSTSDTVGETRVKIIRNGHIGFYSWDTSDSTINSGNGVNDWTQADLMTELNETYYNSQSGNCYNGINNAFIACDFTSVGPNDSSKTMIDNALWYLGSGNTSGVYANGFYDFERGSTVYSGRPTSWVGIVGLMYASDYAYASDLSICINTLSTFNTDTTCNESNWIHKGNYYQWTITPYRSTAWSAYLLYPSGLLAPSDYGYNDASVRPAVYLKSNVIITGGSGTSDNPYQIALSE